MPVDQYGRWESWERRKERLERESAQDDAPVAAPAEAPAKAQRKRRVSRKAAEQAAAEATGVTVTIESKGDALPDVPDFTDEDEDPDVTA